MSQIHQQYMKLKGPTDVMTFELEHDRRGKVVAGEVIICLGEARRQATAHGTHVREELLLYAIHGLLHLSGFDDRTAASHAAMHRKEDQILQRIGVGPVFARKPRQRRRRGR
jgi:probable rRNA maturation factor